MNEPAQYGIVSADILREMSGLDFFRSVIAGRLPRPPIGALLGYVLVEAEEGWVAFASTPREAHYNAIGSVHGGYTATLLDSCMGCAVHTRLKPGQGYTTLELKVNYIRGMSAKTGPVRAEGKVVHFGSQIATAEGRLIDANGRLLAHGTTTCLVFALPDKRGSETGP